MKWTTLLLTMLLTQPSCSLVFVSADLDEADAGGADAGGGSDAGTDAADALDGGGLGPGADPASPDAPLTIIVEDPLAIVFLYIGTNTNVASHKQCSDTCSWLLATQEVYTLQVHPPTDYQFDRWQGDDCLLPQGSTVNFEFTAAQSCTAQFTQ